MRTLMMILLVSLLVPAILRAQTPEENDALAVVTRLFDGMRAGDSTMVRSTLDPSARLVSASEREGVPVLQSESMDAFVAAVGSPHEKVWDERIWDTEVRIDDRLATIWTQYAFFLGPDFSHCGVDAFQLFRGEDGWKIFQIADTRRREGCDTGPE
jgi:hypothetical protein